ncbi:cytochrome P450 [Bradyrhizobium sp. USDA 4471]
MSSLEAPENTEPTFNPFSPAFLQDPYSHYARLRAFDPVHLARFGAYVISRHADVGFVLRDRRFGKDFIERSRRHYGPEIMAETLFDHMSRTMLLSDPPQHERLRGLVVKAFTARRVEAMRPRIQQVVDYAIDAVLDVGKMDLVADFAHHPPVAIICDMLGIPEEDRTLFHACSEDSVKILESAPFTPEELATANGRVQTVRSYFERLYEQRRRCPGDDLTTQLMQSEESGSKLTNEELTASIMLLFVAGHETTINLIGNGLLALHRNPQQLALLRDRPDLIGSAVDEFLRYEPSIQFTGRVALEDVEDLHGKTIPKGANVLCLLASANRDEAAYPEIGRNSSISPDMAEEIHRLAAAFTSVSGLNLRDCKQR